MEKSLFHVEVNVTGDERDVITVRQPADDVDCIYVRQGDAEFIISPAEAREMAAALLDAAPVVEAA